MNISCILDQTKLWKVTSIVLLKELSLCHKLKFSNLYIFTTGWCRPLIFQTNIIWSNRILSLKYLRHWVAQILGLENLCLWQRLNSFVFVSSVTINWPLIVRLLKTWDVLDYPHCTTFFFNQSYFEKIYLIWHNIVLMV